MDTHKMHGLGEGSVHPIIPMYTVHEKGFCISSLSQNPLCLIPFFFSNNIS